MGEMADLALQQCLDMHGWEGDIASLFIPVDYTIWKTADGREIPISKMENSHLMNTAQFIKRAIDRHTKDCELVEYLNKYLCNIKVEIHKRGLYYNERGSRAVSYKKADAKKTNFISRILNKIKRK